MLAFKEFPPVIEWLTHFGVERNLMDVSPPGTKGVAGNKVI